jgi:hypothetical protein
LLLNAQHYNHLCSSTPSTAIIFVVPRFMRGIQSGCHLVLLDAQHDNHLYYSTPSTATIFVVPRYMRGIQRGYLVLLDAAHKARHDAAYRYEVYYGY